MMFIIINILMMLILILILMPVLKLEKGDSSI